MSVTQRRHLLVATDIFGSTAALKHALTALQVALNGELFITICQPDSCNTAAHVFPDDQQAYQAFAQQGGLASYQQQICQALAAQQPHLVLGFSAGAAALWYSLSHHHLVTHAGKALLCYGGQIRQYIERRPAWPVTCLWSDESHFDVVALQHQLQENASQQAELQQLHWRYPHGFVNPLSAGFDTKAAEQFWQHCQRWIEAGQF